MASEANNIITDTIAYLKIKQLLSDASVENSFANYLDNARRRIIIISATKGTLLIGFPIITPKITSTDDLRLLYLKLSNSISAKGFMSFFKSEAYDQLKNVEEEGRFEFLIQNLALILENAERNYEVYLSNFSFDQLKDRLTLERIKYFNTTKEILAKIYTQITSIPIAISATAFATYKVDSRFTLALIFLTFLIYSIFVLKILFLLRSEIITLSDDFKIEQPRIIGFAKLDETTIKKEINSINRRIKDVLDIANVFIVMFILLTVLFQSFLLYQFCFPKQMSVESPLQKFYNVTFSHSWKFFRPVLSCLWIPFCECFC